MIRSLFAKDPTRLAVLCLTVAVSGCASMGKGAPLPAVAAEQSRIVIYRAPSPLALSATRPAVWIDDRKLGPAFACAYRVIDTAPGTYRVSIGDTVRRSVEIALEPGETRYLHAYVSTGADLREGGIEVADAKMAARLVPRLNAVAVDADPR
jgi:hypothetical protein